MHAVADRMVADGWCVHQVRYLTRTFDVETVTYFASLGRSTKRPESHEACLRESSCVAYNVDNDSYETRHTDACDGDCEMIFMPEEELIRTVAQGNIPLFSLHRDPENPLRLSIKVHKRKPSSNYVAISHVWYDGLGNPDSNALPTCQLQKFGTEMLFWMDTLCLPLKKDHAFLWEQSLNSMASIYAGASTTLVIDAELEALSTNIYDALCRLVCSVWMRRSWTLQEGLLSPTCIICFAEDSFKFSSMNERNCMEVWRPRPLPGTVAPRSQPDAMSDSVRRDLQEYLAQHFRRTKHVLRLKERQYAYNLDVLGERYQRPYLTYWEECRMIEDKEEPYGSSKLPVTETVIETALSNRFVLVWNSLTGRSTTKGDDVPLILANILDFSCSRLLPLSRGDRWQAIIFSMPRLPLSLLFISTEKVEREDRPLNRWVPVNPCTELLDGGSTLIFVPRGQNVGPDSLEIKKGKDFGCIVVKDASLLRCDEFVVCIPGSLLSFICEGPGDKLPAVPFGASEEVCIIFDGEYDFGSGSRGAVLQVLRREENAIFLAYRCSISITVSSQFSKPLTDHGIYQGAFLSFHIRLFLAYNDPKLPKLPQHDQQSIGLFSGISFTHWLIERPVTASYLVLLALWFRGSETRSNNLTTGLLSLLLILVFLAKHMLWACVQKYWDTKRRSRHLHALIPSDPTRVRRSGMEPLD